MDYGGAAKLVEAAEERGARRYLMLSSIGADDPEAGSNNPYSPECVEGEFSEVGYTSAYQA
jgi:hypothetical protein